MFFHVVNFSIRSLSILIIVILNSMSDHSQIFVISEYGSNSWFVYSYFVFSLLACFVTFLLKEDKYIRQKNQGRQFFGVRFYVYRVGS